MGRLYKYRALSGDARERVRQTILESVNWFASPLTFNDPFDCSVVPVMEGTEAQRRVYYGKALAFHLDRDGYINLEPDFASKVMRGEFDAFDELVRRANSGKISIPVKELQRLLDENLSDDSTVRRQLALDMHRQNVEGLGVLSLGG